MGISWFIECLYTYPHGIFLRKWIYVDLMASHILWKWAITCYNTGIAILRGNMATNVMGCVDSYTPKILETLDFKESGEFSHCFLFVGPFCSFQTPRITYLFQKQKPLVSKRMQGKSSKQVSVYAELWLIRDGFFSWTQMGLPRPHFAVWDSHRSRQSGLWSTCFFLLNKTCGLIWLDWLDVKSAQMSYLLY